MKTLSIREVFGTSWKLLAKRWQILLIASLCVSVVSGIISSTSTAVGKNDNIVLLSLAINIIGMIVSVFLSIGLTMITLHIARDQDAKLNELLQGGKYLLRILGAGIIIGIILFFTFFALLIPCIYFALRFQLFSYAIIDQNKGGLESLTESTRLTKGVMWRLLGINAIMFGFVGIVAIATLGTSLGTILSTLNSGNTLQLTDLSGIAAPIVIFAVFGFVFGLYMNVVRAYIYTSLLKQSGTTI